MSTNKNPLVSVIIPMYNVSKYINACIDSVLAQSFQNFEIVCVNDGCTDDTLEKLKKYDDTRITIINQTNAGLSAARNTGIFAARGLYVALLDSDDFWEPKKLALHIKHLNSNPNIVVSYSPSWFVNEEGEPIGIGQFPKLKGITLRDVMCRNPVGNGSAPVIRRSALLQHRQFNISLNKEQIFNESLRQSEDIELWLRIALRTPNGFEGISEPLTYYRVNSTGLSANIKKQYQSWYFAIWSIAKKQTKTLQYFSLAKAYQKRYLARRAIQSGDRWNGLLLIHQAIFTNPKIFWQEPSRTSITYICAFLRLLPVFVYQNIEKLAHVFVAAKLVKGQLA